MASPHHHHHHHHPQQKHHPHGLWHRCGCHHHHHRPHYLGCRHHFVYRECKQQERQQQHQHQHQHVMLMTSTTNHVTLGCRHEISEQQAIKVAAGLGKSMRIRRSAFNGRLGTRNHLAKGREVLFVFLLKLSFTGR